MVQVERPAGPVRLSFLKSVRQAAAVQSGIFEPKVGNLRPGAVAPLRMNGHADERAARHAIGAADFKDVWP